MDPAAVKLGKRPASRLRSSTPRYGELRPTLRAKGLLPKIPPSFGHSRIFGRGHGWLMLGNGPDDTVFPGFQGCGDCAWAGPAHAEMEAAKLAGRPVPKFSGKTIVDQYSAYSGYDPRTGVNDTGSDPQEVFSWRQEKGLLDDDSNVYKIGQVVAFEPGNLTELLEAAYLFENAGIGVVVAQAQMDQFSAGAPWDYAAGSPDEGGHWIEVMGANPTYGALITWAQRVLFTHTFYLRQNDETFAYVDPLRYNAVTGETAEHYLDQDLEKFLILVAQQKAAA